jgi:hypothetical protein
MEGRNIRVAGLGIFALLALLAVASPSSAQCVGPGPSGGTCVVVAPSDDASTSVDLPVLLRATSLRYPLLGLFGSMVWGRTPTSVATSSPAVDPHGSRATLLAPKARAKAGRL